MTTFISKYNRYTKEETFFVDGKQVTKEEYDAAHFSNREASVMDGLRHVKCESCGNHKYVSKNKNGSARKTKCQDCGEYMVEQIEIFCKKDESQVRRMVQKFNHEGYNKDQAKQFYDSSIEGTSRRIEGVGGAQHYKQMLPDMDYMVKNGVAKPLDTEDAAKRQQARKEVIVKHTAGKKNFKANRSNNTQSIK